jgi:hypothetical protein
MGGPQGPIVRPRLDRHPWELNRVVLPATDLLGDENEDQILELAALTL